jgi:Prolyl oligopeptidase family
MTTRILLVWLIFTSVAVAGGTTVQRDVTTEDVVRFAEIGDPRTPGADSFDETPNLLYSPSGASFAVVVRRGDVERETNDAELIIYRSDGLMTRPKSKLVAEFASSENRPPISFLRWLSDDQLLFLGNNGTSLPQVYEVMLRTGKVTQLTTATDQIIGFFTTEDGNYVVTFDQVPDRPPDRRPDCLEKGCRIPDANLMDTRLTIVERGEYTGSPPMSWMERKSGRVRKLAPPETQIDRIESCPFARLEGGLSPGGTYGLRLCRFKRDQWPDWWSKYKAESGSRGLSLLSDSPNSRPWVLSIIDFRKGTTRVLSSAPYTGHSVLADGSSAILWIDRGRHLLLVGGYESLDVADATETVRRAAGMEVLEIDPDSGLVTPVARLPENSRAKWARWDQAGNRLCVGLGPVHGDPSQAMCYRRTIGGWEGAGSTDAAAPQETSTKGNLRIQVRIEESPNDRPRLIALDSRTGETRVLLDPNPWLQQRKLGRVETMTWTSSDGRQFRGGFYYPPDYLPTTRYPVVIQTHGFKDDMFSMTGNVTNDNARALGAVGIAVLQMDDLHGHSLDPQGLVQAQKGYEGAIDYLDSRGLIDRTKVGIQGWSVTGTYVAYTLTHSTYRFAANAFTSTTVAGLWWYLFDGFGQANLETYFGAAPFGRSLEEWRRYDPDMLLDKVNTPTIMWSEGSDGGIGALWDWYSGLRRMGVPVEYWYFPDGAHTVYKVGERLHASQLLVDWFRFWLKDEEDLSPTKADQYRRWRTMKNIFVRAANVRSDDDENRHGWERRVGN